MLIRRVLQVLAVASLLGVSACAMSAPPPSPKPSVPSPTRVIPPPPPIEVIRPK